MDGPIRRVLLVFVDGLGLGRSDPAVNPLRREVCPCLAGLLDGCARVDATLGVPGLPQSATGQTTLLTGVNAAAAVGRHVEGFPTRALRRILEQESVYRAVVAAGRSATFANGYFEPDPSVVALRRLQSATTVAALSGLGVVRCAGEIERNEAVCHDLTRASLVPRGYRGPLVSPSDAADHLAAIAAGHALTVFEHFVTDRAGHEGDMAKAAAVLQTFDAFLERLCSRLAQHGLTLALTSDHGNIEDLSVRTHTMNPVPFAVRPQEAGAGFGAVGSLTDVTPAILRALGIARPRCEGPVESRTGRAQA